MRRNFAQVLKEANINLKEEYKKLYNMLYSRSIQVSDRKLISIHDELGDAFPSFYFRGTCLTIEEFDKKHGFEFTEDPDDFSVDSLVSICEYICNMLFAYQNYSGNGFFPQAINVQFCLSQIMAVIESIGYMQAAENGLVIFVEKSPAAVSVAELIPDGLSYKVISYNHYSMRGNLDAKKNTLLMFADMLEPRRSELTQIDVGFTSDLFYAFNSFNIRHNNVDPAGTKYKKPVGDLTKEQLEQWYDEVYQMCLLAFLRLEHVPRKQEFDTLKDKIENKR